MRDFGTHMRTTTLASCICGRKSYHHCFLYNLVLPLFIYLRLHPIQPLQDLFRPDLQDSQSDL